MNQVSEKRWNAVLSRDKTEIGKLSPFFYAVKTTKIFCRPGCGSRTPKQGNVEFFNSSEEARNAGYRPCKRCRPDTDCENEDMQDTEKLRIIAAACRLLESEDTKPSLERLAKQSDMSTGHFHRVFKNIVGLTPHEYGAAVRTGRFLESLRDGLTVSDAIYEAGYSAPSRAYEELKKHSGFSPVLHQNGAPGQILYFAVAPCHLGWTIIAISDKGLCSVLFGDSPEVLPKLLAKRFPKATLLETSPAASDLIAGALRQMDSAAQGDPKSMLPLDIRGTAFQKRVWKALQAVPAGRTATYAEIAAKIGNPKSVRAVANACGANKIALFVPCHRIIRSDGQPGGYRWGLKRKRLLLMEERAGGTP